MDSVDKNVGDALTLDCPCGAPLKMGVVDSVDNEKKKSIKVRKCIQLHIVTVVGC